MKKRFSIVNFSLGIAILFAVLFQSVHGIEHLARQFSEKHCDHHYAVDENQVSHSHHDAENCFSCEFTFSHFTSADIFRLAISHDLIQAGKLLSYKASSTEYFRGSRFSLRGPPSFIV